jgi:hypothetical protein
VFCGNILGATGTQSVSSEVRFKLVPMNFLSNMLLVEINQMLSSVALSSCVIVTTTPLTSLGVVMSIIFLESVLVVSRTLAFLKILLLPFPLEIPLNFLPLNFLLLF